MAQQVNQPQTRIVDLPADTRELTVDELPLIVGGGVTYFGPATDSTDTGRISDAPKNH